MDGGSLGGSNKLCNYSRKKASVIDIGRSKIRGPESMPGLASCTSYRRDGWVLFRDDVSSLVVVKSFSCQERLSFGELG